MLPLLPERAPQPSGLRRRPTFSALLAGYCQRGFGTAMEGVEDYRGFAAACPIISYRSIEGNLADYAPPDTSFYLRSRGFTGIPKQVPMSAPLLQAAVASLAGWLGELLSPGARALSVETLQEETLRQPGAILPSWAALARQLDATGQVTVLAEAAPEIALFQRLALELSSETEILIGTATRVLAFVRHLSAKGTISLLRPVRFALLTGTAEIETLFGPEIRRFAPKLEVREFYAATEGIFAFQEDEAPGLFFQRSSCFFELESGKRVFPLDAAGRGESGSLIVSSEVFPRYRIGDLLLHTGGGRWQVLGKDGRTTRMGYFLKHAFLPAPPAPRRPPAFSPAPKVKEPK